MKKIKFIVGIMGLLCVMGFSYGAELRILPETRSVGKNCIESFDIYLNLKDGEEALASDIILDSNMEFINFENAGLFQRYIPPRNVGKVNYIGLLNMGGNNITGGGLLGTLYYKVVSDESYINFYFEGEGKTVDTNVSIAGRDILKKVTGGKYYVDDLLSCDEYTGQYYNGENYNEIIDGLVDEIKSLDSNNKHTFIIVFISLFLILLLILLYILVKKGKRN